jgi:hypothetical protein
MLAATWIATSSCNRAQTCSWARMQWRVRDVGCGPCGRQQEGGRGREGRIGADVDGADVDGQTGMWARTAMAGTGMWARTLLRV